MTTQAQQARLPVRSVQELGGDQVLLSLDLRDLPGGAEFRAGQFAQLAVPGRVLPRPFSILRAGAGRLDFLVKVVGEGSAWLARRAAGDELSVVWPLGHGWLDSLDSPASDEMWLLAGGGVGIAPLIALWEQEAARRPLLAAFGFRNRAGVEAVRPLLEGMDVRFSTEDGSLGHAGRLPGLLDRLLGELMPRALRIFCCGPDPLMEAVARQAQAAGLPCRLSLETLMGCGIGICVGCAVPRPEGGFQLACQAGPVFEAEELAWPI